MGASNPRYHRSAEELNQYRDEVYTQIDKKIDGTGLFQRLEGRPLLNADFITKNQKRYVKQCVEKWKIPSKECQTRFSHALEGSVAAFQTDIQLTMNHMVHCTLKNKDVNDCIHAAASEGLNAFNRIDERLATV